MSSVPASGPQAAPSTRCVLLVDDDPLITRSLERALLALRSNLEIIRAHSADEAIVALNQRAFDAVVTDLQMPGLSGIDWLERLRLEQPAAVCVVHSSQLEAFGEDEVRRLCHTAFDKPALPQTLIASLEALWALRAEAPQRGLRSA